MFSIVVSTLLGSSIAALVIGVCKSVYATMAENQYISVLEKPVQPVAQHNSSMVH